jgi:hypothetical protein
MSHLKAASGERLLLAVSGLSAFERWSWKADVRLVAGAYTRFRPIADIRLGAARATSSGSSRATKHEKRTLTSATATSKLDRERTCVR